jgi:hypothetical protein
MILLEKILLPQLIEAECSYNLVLDCVEPLEQPARVLALYFSKTSCGIEVSHMISTLQLPQLRLCTLFSCLTRDASFP